jgi:hypothetical protein
VKDVDQYDVLAEHAVKKVKVNKDGLPLDAKDWTVEDWRDLHQTIERIKKRVAKRHKTNANARQGRESRG